MAETNNSILQYSQEETLDTAGALEDILAASKKNGQLDALQIRNIGIGLFGDSPISSITGKLNTNIGFDRINQSFKVILRTVCGEVPMLPILGSKMNELLFEPIDEVLTDTINVAISSSLQKLEPRAKILTLNVDTDEKDQNKLHLTIEYVLTNTNICYVFRDTIVTGNGGDVL